MSAIAARVGRAVLAVAAIAAAVAAVGLVDNPRIPGWLIGACAVVALFAGSAWYWTGLARRGRAPSIDRHTEPVPGGAIAWTIKPGSREHHDTVVYPDDPHGPVRVGTVSPMTLGQLRAAPDALYLRVRATLAGGVR